MSVSKTRPVRSATQKPKPGPERRSSGRRPPPKRKMYEYESDFLFDDFVSEPEGERTSTKNRRSSVTKPQEPVRSTRKSSTVIDSEEDFFEAEEPLRRKVQLRRKGIEPQTRRRNSRSQRKQRELSDSSDMEPGANGRSAPSKRKSDDYESDFVSDDVASEEMVSVDEQESATSSLTEISETDSDAS